MHALSDTHPAFASQALNVSTTITVGNILALAIFCFGWGWSKAKMTSSIRAEVGAAVDPYAEIQAKKLLATVPLAPKD